MTCLERFDFVESIHRYPYSQGRLYVLIVMKPLEISGKILPPAVSTAAKLGSCYICSLLTRKSVISRMEKRVPGELAHPCNFGSTYLNHLSPPHFDTDTY